MDLFPPLTVRFTAPVLNPLHNIFTPVIDKEIGFAGSVRIMDMVSVHPLESVTVTEYVPAGTLSRFCVVFPLFHRYVYGFVPPLTVKSTDPVLSP